MAKVSNNSYIATRKPKSSRGKKSSGIEQKDTEKIETPASIERFWKKEQEKKLKELEKPMKSRPKGFPV